jgi:hypothetical protein
VVRDENGHDHGNALTESASESETLRQSGNDGDDLHANANDSSWRSNEAGNESGRHESANDLHEQIGEEYASANDSGGTASAGLHRRHEQKASGWDVSANESDVYWFVRRESLEYACENSSERQAWSESASAHANENALHGDDGHPWQTSQTG